MPKMLFRKVLSLILLLSGLAAAGAQTALPVELDICSGKHGRIVLKSGRPVRIGKRYFRLLNAAPPARSDKFYVFLEVKETGNDRIELEIRNGKKVLKQFRQPASRQWQWVRIGPLTTVDCRPDFDVCVGSSRKSQIQLARAVIAVDPDWNSSRGTAGQLNAPGLAVGTGPDGIEAGPFLLVRDNRFAEDQTSVRFRWDAEALYADFTSHDRSLDPKANRLHEFKTKEKNPWRNDYTVLLLKRGEVLYDFLVSGAGRLDDARMTGPDFWEHRDRTWQSGAEASAKIENGLWRSSLRIPWKAIGGAPKPGEQIRFQAGRKAQSSRETSMLFPSKTGYHAVEDFGIMSFRKSSIPKLKIQLPAFLPGDNQIALPSSVNAEIHVQFQDKNPQFYRGGAFQLNGSGKFSFQWNMSDPETGAPWFVSPSYSLAVTACRLEFTSAKTIGLNGVQVKSGTIMRNGLNRIQLPPGFSGKLSAGGTAVVPPAADFTLAVESSLLWPNWHEKELAVPASGVQMLMFAPRGFPGKTIRDYTIKLDLPPGFKLECASGYYQNYKIQWTEDGWIRFLTPLRFSDLPPLHKFISVFIRAPHKTAVPVSEIAYAVSSPSEKIVEVPRKFKVRLLPAFTGVRPRRFRIIVWSGWYKNLTDRDYLQRLVQEFAKYGINEVNAIPGRHLPFSHNFNLKTWSWSPAPYVKMHPESALIRKDGKKNTDLVCPQHIRTPDFARWLNAQMPHWLKRAGNPPVVEWDYENPVSSGPFSCFCEKCKNEADVASRNRMTAYYARLIRDALKRCDPKIMFVIYSGYQSDETKSHYGIDWSLYPGIIDMAECGYGRPAKALEATKKAIGNTPLVTGAIIRPYLPTSRAFPEQYTPALLLRRALDATGGILLFEYSLFDGTSLRAIAAISRLAAKYEDHFRFGTRVNHSIPGWNPDEVQIVKYQGNSILFLMNSGKKPKKYRDRVIEPGGILAEPVLQH